jgi:phage terminase large subunit GpA-like protein
MPPTNLKFAPIAPVLSLRERLTLVRQQSLKPPPKLNLVEWADEYRYLSKEASARPGKWTTATVEAARGPMMAYSDPDVRIVTIQCATQFMKTEFLLNIMGYHIHQDPAPMIAIQPGIREAEAFSKDRVKPMLRDSPVLAAIMPPTKTRDGGDTILHKQFPSGHITFVGANAPSGLAMRPVRVVLCDEINKYPKSAGKEGDPVSLIAERMATFWNSKLVHVCSPTIEGDSRITDEYEAGDQRVFEPPCPFCGHREEMKWSHVKWEGRNAKTAYYECQGCKQPWDDVTRRRAIESTRFLPSLGWRATKEFNGHASFRVSKLASPWEPLSKIVQKFLNAGSNPERLKTFVNTQLAETWKQSGDAPEWKRLYDRRETYAINSVPEGVRVLMCGVDIQKDYIACEIVGFGRDAESWSIDYRNFSGKPADNEGSPTSPWRELEKVLNEEWRHPSGARLRVRMMAVDSQYETQTVLRWVRRQSAERVIAIRGEERYPQAIGAPRAVEVHLRGRKKPRGAKQWPVGTNILKNEIYSFLKQEKPTEESKEKLPYGFCHFPQYNEAYFRGITAEQIVPKVIRGYTKFEWTKVYDRNEPLDCRVYASALRVLGGYDRMTPQQWTELEVGLGLADASEGVIVNADSAPDPDDGTPRDPAPPVPAKGSRRIKLVDPVGHWNDGYTSRDRD